MFAIRRVTGFLQKFYHDNGAEGFVLKCDIRKYFNNIDHAVLKEKLQRVITDPDILSTLCLIIDSYSYSPGRGLPMGNQISQWFALYYLDGLDRLIKERLRIRYYSRYMDDCVLIHSDKDYLKYCLKTLREYIRTELHLEFNEKTQIIPIRNGIDYLGFHFYLTDSGKVIRKVRRRTKQKFKKRLKYYQAAYRKDSCTLQEVSQTINSYTAHLKHGHTWHLRKKILSEFVLTHGG